MRGKMTWMRMIGWLLIGGVLAGPLIGTDAQARGRASSSGRAVAHHGRTVGAPRIHASHLHLRRGRAK